MTTIEALGAWGAYDRDDPFPVFADVRELGAVHPVTLADGHDAWLVVGYDEARSALNDRRFSKDMHAALASGGGVVAEGLPGPTFARHMLTVDPPDHSRLRRLVSLAFTPRRVERLLPGVQALVDDLLDDVAAAGPDARVDLVSSFAFPLPFTVICELLGVPEPDREPLGRGLQRLLVPTTTPEEYARAKLLMLPVLDPDGATTSRQMVLYCLALVSASLAPALLGAAGLLYIAGALSLGLYFTLSAVRFWATRSVDCARSVLRASLVYLPGLLLVLLADRAVGLFLLG